MSVTYHPIIPTLAKFGDYSPVAEAGQGEVVAVAGQFGTDASRQFPVSDSAEDQVRGAFANVGRALDAVGLDFRHVVKFTTYLVGRETIPAFMAIRREVFAEIYPEGVYPPNTLLIVSGLVEERFVAEIEAIAVRPTESGG